MLTTVTTDALKCSKNTENTIAETNTSYTHPENPVRAATRAHRGLPASRFWDDQFCKLSGPEIFRWPLARRSAAETAGWLREYARAVLVQRL